jgi:uncharacterized protein
MELFIAAITLGFLGSFHCIGMCGPIALALPIHTATPFKKLFLTLSYNGGRIVTYSIFGLFAGLLGYTFAMAGYQQLLSVVVGISLLLSVILHYMSLKITILHLSIFKFFGSLKTKFGKLLLKNGHGPLFTIGLLNGLLPCGLVYVGIAGAVTSGDIFKGTLFMALFGLGTLPAMLALPLAGSFIGNGTRNAIRKTMPAIIGITAVLLIVRGLDLGIPYLSPSSSGEPSCHTVTITSKKHIILCTGPNSAHKR